MNVLNDVSPGVKRHVLYFFLYDKIQYDGALECFVYPVDVPVNMLVHNFYLIDVGKCRVIYLGVGRLVVYHRFWVFSKWSLVSQHFCNEAGKQQVNRFSHYY